jgi:AcrR family transcriptional regulator
MAQILKPELKEAIIQSARNEFYSHGFEGASMRNIAKAAHMTVGNLYRYFENKEDLADALLSSTIEKIDRIITGEINNLPSNNSFEQGRSAEFDARIRRLSMGFAQLFETERKEFMTLIRHQRMADQVVASIKKIITVMVERWFSQVDLFDRRTDMITSMLANSIFCGLVRLFEDSLQSNQEEIEWMIMTYLNLFTLMISAGDSHYEKK